MSFTVATWNVNSLKVRMPHLADWLKERQPDVVALQETKTEDAEFPVLALDDLGYACAYAGQKAYNGVAVLARNPLEIGEVTRVIPGFPDEHRRVLAATVRGVRVIGLYVPNGQSVGSDKYRYKLDWLAALARWLGGELARHERLAVIGDFNVAPEPRDVHDPKAWEGHVLFSEPERAAFRALLDLGLKDAFRLIDQPERSYTWWDYRMLAFQKKRGLRIDHVLLSPALAEACTACTIDVAPRKRERPSDHAPVLATLAI